MYQPSNCKVGSIIFQGLTTKGFLQTFLNISDIKIDNSYNYHILLTFYHSFYFLGNPKISYLDYRSRKVEGKSVEHNVR